MWQLARVSGTGRPGGPVPRPGNGGGGRPETGADRLGHSGCKTAAARPGPRDKAGYGGGSGPGPAAGRTQTETVDGTETDT